MSQYPIQYFASSLPVGWQSMAKDAQQDFQPTETQALPPLPVDPNHPRMVGWQEWQNAGKATSSGALLLIVGFLGGALLGGGVVALVAVNKPQSEPVIVNNPPQNIYNPNCRLFCN